MAGNPKSYKMGPGSLVIGETGSPLEIACQITACTVEFETDSEDDVPTLCGGTLAGDETETATLTGTIIQDLSDAGVVDYTWTHSGEVTDVTFVPNSDAGRTITGQVKVRSLNVGGDVRTSPTSDFEWPFVGKPAMSPATGVDEVAELESVM